MRALAIMLTLVLLSGCAEFRERNRRMTFEPREVVPLDHAGWRSAEHRELNLERLERERARRLRSDWRWVDLF